MPLDIIDTVGNRIHILDNGTTIEDLLYALGWVERERERHRIKNATRVRPPTGRPRGRPRKTPPVPENPEP